MVEAASIGGQQRAAPGPLRILFVSSDKFPPFRPAARAIFSEGLPAEGHRVDWLLQAGRAEVRGGVRRFRGGTACVAPTHDGTSRLARLRKYWWDFRNDLRVFTLLRRRRYSLVQVKDKYIGALIVLAAARLAGRVPVVYWLAYPHAEASLYAADQGVARYALFYRIRGHVQRWLLYRVIMPACRFVFVQSEQMRVDVEREGIPLEKTAAVPSSINLDALDVQRSARREPGDEPPARTIVYLGTLLRERRLDFLIRVLARVLPRVPGAHLVFVGRGENADDEALLWREADRHGVRDRITITGWLPMPRAWEQVEDAAVCVSPYYPVPILLSTSPTKLIEYMAFEKPVVANDHPEQSEVIERSGGGIVCAWDESEFADAIVRLLAEPQVAAALGRAGRRFVEEHRTHSVMVDLVLARYRAMLDGSAAGRALRAVGNVARDAAESAR